MDDINTLCQEIRLGLYDDHIALLKGEIINRHTLLMSKDLADAAGELLIQRMNPVAATRTKTIWDFQVGTRVRFNDKVTPQYMIGKFAQVVKVNRERVKVKLEEGPTGRFSGAPLSCPISIIDICK